MNRFKLGLKDFKKHDSSKNDSARMIISLHIFTYSGSHGPTLDLVQQKTDQPHSIFFLSGRLGMNYLETSRFSLNRTGQKHDPPIFNYIYSVLKNPACPRASCCSPCSPRYVLYVYCFFFFFFQLLPENNHLFKCKSVVRP